MNKEVKEIDYVVKDKCDNSSCSEFGKVVTYTTEDSPHNFIEATGFKFAPGLGKEVEMVSMFPIKRVCIKCMNVKKVVSKEPYEKVVNRFKTIATKKAKGDRSKNYYKDWSIKSNDLKTDPNAGKGYEKLSAEESKSINDRFERISNNNN
jgi:hypothetical protein